MRREGCWVPRATRFPVDAFERDRLPQICLLSGEPTGDRLRSKVSSRPDVLWLLLFGIVPYVIARAILTKTVSGTLPVSEDVYVVMKARRRSAHPFYVVGLAVLVLGVLVLAASPQVGVALAFLGLGVIVIGGFTPKSGILSGVSSSTPRGGGSSSRTPPMSLLRPWPRA